jgi:hypothetical protein
MVRLARCPYFSFCRLTDRLASELVLMAPQVSLVDDVSHVAFLQANGLKNIRGWA